LLHTCRGHKAEVEALAFAPDGTLVATGDWAGMILVWDPNTGKPVAVQDCSPEFRQTWQLCFDASSKHLVAIGYDGTTTQSHLVAWSVQRSSEAVALDHFADHTIQTYLTDLAMSDTGDVLVADAYGRLYAWSLTSSSVPQLLKIPAKQASADDLRFTSSGQHLTHVTWDWKQGVLLRTLGGEAAPLRLVPIHSRLVISPCERWFATQKPSDRLGIYSLESGAELFTLPAESAGIWPLAWSPDGRQVAIGLTDGTTAIWDLEMVRASLQELGIDVPSTVPNRK
jgi:WD40 repeat protein